jgi:UDP-glucose 4-epimerase
MAKYLVTGGCGFIGSHLSDALAADGHSVRILDDLSTGRRENAPKQAEILVGDVADAALVRRALAGCDGCFHLAAIASVQRGNEDWLGTHAANLTGTIAVLDAAREGRLPVVYASSAAVYGDNPEQPLKESAATRPLSAYGADKLGSELHARVGTLAHGVPTFGFRFFNVYGPRQDPSSPYSGVISIFADRLKAGGEVVFFGDGGQSRDFVYVADVVRHLLAAMRRRPEPPAVFNVCTGRSTTIRELASVLARLCGVELRVSTQPERIGDIRVSLGDPTAATAALGVAAEISLAEGLRRTLVG